MGCISVTDKGTNLYKEGKPCVFRFIFQSQGLDGGWILDRDLSPKYLLPEVGIYSWSNSYFVFFRVTNQVQYHIIRALPCGLNRTLPNWTQKNLVTWYTHGWRKIWQLVLLWITLTSYEKTLFNFWEYGWAGQTKYKIHYKKRLRQHVITYKAKICQPFQKKMNKYI